MKSDFQKQKPTIINHRNSKSFNKENFRNGLLHEISKKGFRHINCEVSQSLFMVILNQHAPMNTKCIIANNSPFINNDLSKAIMVRSRLRNKSLKLKNKESRDAHKKQRNYCI